MNYSIILLGHPVIKCNDIPVDEKRKKLLGIIFYLAAEHRPVGRDKLQSLFWPNADLSSAKHNLNVSLYAIWKKYPGLIESVNFGTALQISDYAEVDLHKFLSSTSPDLALPPPIQALEHALSLYKGAFLDNFQVDSSPDFDTWRTIAAEKVDGLYIDTLVQLSKAETERNDFSRAASYLQCALEIDSFREDLYRLLMTCQSLKGDYLKVQKTYEKLKRVLRDEIGIDPMSETQELYNSIMQKSSRQEIDNFKFTTNIRPIIIDGQGLLPFIGRDNELSDTLSILKKYPRHMVLIHGRSGSGKTRFLQECISHFDGFVLYGTCPKFKETTRCQPIAEAIAAIASSESWKQQYTVFKRQFNSVLWQNLRWSIPEIDPYDTSTPLPPSSDQNLIDAIKRFIFLISKNENVLLVIDDLHSASHDTISLLSSIFNDRNQGNLYYLCSDRPAVFNPYIAKFIQKADYSNRLHHITLERLGTPCVKKYADLIDPDNEVVFNWLEKKTAGNVFCMIAYVKHMLNELSKYPDTSKQRAITDIIETDAVPTSISSYILHGILRLSPLASRTLYTASVYGMEFNFESVAQNVGLQEDNMLNVLQELVHYSFIRLKANGNYCFDQSAVRDALYADLSPAYRNVVRKKMQ